MSVACSVPRRHRIISLVAENTENDRVPDTNKRRWIIKMSERDKDVLILAVIETYAFDARNLL
jgi:hypothetical protein